MITTCDYQDNTIKFEQYKEYINYPCPACGSPLLTQADYDTTLELIQLFKYAETLTPLSAGDEEKVKITVELNGSGIPKFNIQELD